MLRDFFKLNTPFTTISTLADLESRLQTTDSLKDFLFTPNLVPPDDYGHPKIKFAGKTFTNASFSKKLIKDVIFTKCNFIDCLFIGSKIENCEFHECSFENVNTNKIEISKTYLNPNDFKRAITDNQYSNVAVHLFQKILDNLKSTDQPILARQAEYYFLDWERIQYWQNWKRRKIPFGEFLRKTVPRLLLYLVGYGIRFERFLITYSVFLFICCLANHNLWNYYDVKSDLFKVGQLHSKIHSAYFTFYTTTSLGAGAMYPQSNLGIILAIAQSIIGYTFICVFLSMLIKKIVK